MDGTISERSLALLPWEILAQIFEHLVPDPPEIGETKPVGYDKLVPGEAWYDFTRCRRGLWSLNLVSRHFATIARPLLYRVIAILDEEGMLLFLRTLTDRQDFGHSTRYLSCHLTLTRDSVVREIRRSFGKLLRTFNPHSPGLAVGSPIGRALEIMVVALPVLSTQAGDFDGVPQVLMFFILTYLKNLETLMLQVPICDDHPEYRVLFEKFFQAWDAWEAKLDARQAARQDADLDEDMDEESRPPLQNVETLLLQGDPELLEHFESDDCSCEVPEVWGCQARDYWPLFECIPNLTTLEVSSDDGVWAVTKRDRPHKRPPYLRGIRHLYLHNSIACPRNLYQVLKNAPDLQTLYMTPRREDDFDHGPGGDDTHAHPESLDTALLEHSTKLRHLDVGWFDCRGFETLIGPEGRLSCLPELAHLEKLCIQLCVLYGNNPANLLNPLVGLLPPSLVELTLEEWWEDDIDTYEDMVDWSVIDMITHYQLKQDYRAKAIRILEHFAMSCTSHLPKLRKVTFLIKIPFTWSVEGQVSMASHFSGVKYLLDGHGIEFLVEDA